MINLAFRSVSHPGRLSIAFLTRYPGFSSHSLPLCSCAMPGGGCGFGQFVAGSPVPGSSAYLWPASPSSEGLFEETPPQNKKKGMVAVSLSESPVSSSGIGGSLSGSIHDPLGAYSLTGMRTSQRKRVRRRSGKTPIKTRPRPWRPSPIVGMYSMASSIKKSIVGWRGVLAERYGVVVPGGAIVGGSRPKSAIVGGARPRRSASSWTSGFSKGWGGTSWKSW